MKNLKIVLILMLLSIMSVASLKADELQLGESPCDGFFSGTPWNGARVATVSTGGKIFAVEYYWRLSPVGVIELQSTGLAHIYGGTTATMAELLEAKRLAYILAWKEHGGLGASLVQGTYTTERSCWEHIYSDPFEPDHITVNSSNLIFSISDIVVVDYLNLNPPVSSIYTFNVLQQWKACMGSICCTALMDLTTDSQKNIIEVEFNYMVVTTESDCLSAAYQGCTANCDNLEWNWSNTEGFSKLAFNNEINFLALEISPNPSDGIFRLGFSDDYEGEFEIKINDNLGKLISTFKYNKSVGKFNTELDLQSYSKGFYNISIELDNVKFSQKIIIK